MAWYYSHNNKSVGPVSDADFQVLVKAGTVGPATLVWREGMANWAAFGGVNSGPAPPQFANQTQCGQCHQWFPPDDVLRYEEHHVCGACKPGFFQKLLEGVPVVDLGLWQHGPFLVADPARAAFPDRCVRCNRPAEGFRVQIKTSRFYDLTLRFGFSVRPSATLAYGICRRHRALRSACLWVGGAFGVVFALTLVVSLVGMVFHLRAAGGLLCGGGFCSFIGALIFLSGGQFLSVRSSAGASGYVVLQGAGRKFLNSLSMWRGGK
jgi:hypothetical protein